MAGMTELMLKISADNKASPQIQKVSKDIDKVGKSSTIASSAIKAMGVALVSYLSVRTISTFIKAFEKQEMATKALENALQGAGYQSKIFSEELQTLSAELQKNSVYGDEDNQQMMALLLTYGKSVDEVKKLTPMLTELASKMSLNTRRIVPLKEAYQAYVSVLNGMERPMRQYGINLDDTVVKSRDASNITAELMKNIKGATGALNDTTLGKKTQFANAISDLQEAMGEFITQSPLFERILGNLKFYFEYFTPKKKTAISWLVDDLKSISADMPTFNSEWAALKKSIAGVGEEWGTKLLLQKVKELEKATNTLNKSQDFRKQKVTALRVALEAQLETERQLEQQKQKEIVTAKELAEAERLKAEQEKQNKIAREQLKRDLPIIIAYYQELNEQNLSLLTIGETLPMAFEATGNMWQEAGENIVRGLEPAQMAADGLAGSINGLFYGDCDRSA